MTGNNKNEKGTLKRSEQENAKVANGQPEDDKVLHLKILNDNLKILNDINEKLVKKITGVREENIVLSTNLTEMRSEIESARRMTEEWKENEKEFRKELGRKDAKYQAAISQAGKQLLEAEERFNTEISAKEDKCKTNLEATVLQLRNEIEARSAELEETNKGRKLEKDKFLSQITAAEKETAEISRSNQMALEAFNAEKQQLLSRIAKLQTNLELMVSEKGSLIETNRELSTEAESLKALVNEYSEKLVSMEDEKQALEAVSVSTTERLEDLLKQNATMEKEHGRKHGEYQAAISQADKQLQEAEERFNTEISAKEDECKAVNLDKKNLEATVLHLKNQIEARSAELEANNKGRKLEKDALLSQTAAAEKRIAEISRSNQMAQEAFNAEKENLLSRLAELQTNLELTVSEKGSLNLTNIELTTEAKSLKAHLNEYSERLVRMEDEKKALEAMSVSRAESLEDLLKQNATMEKEHGRKYGEYQAAISQAGKQLQEAEERFNTEISAKEDECKAVNLDKKNLEATVLHLKNLIEARSAELEANNKGRTLEKDALLSQIAAAEERIAEISRSNQMAQEAFNAEKENLLSRLAELQTNLELTASEKGSLRETNRELTTEAESLKAHLNEYSERLVRMEDEKKALEAMSVSRAESLEDLLKQNATMEKEHGRKYGEYQAAISQAGKQLQEAEETFNTEISAKEDECKAVNLDKKNLEATVLHLKNQIEARSAELEANNKGRKLEKDALLSQIAAAEKRIAEISRSNQMAHEAFNADKENLLSRLAELQTNLELTVSEKGSLMETNRELTTEAESLKAHLNEYSERLVRMEDEKKALEAMSVSRAESLEDLLKQNATMEREHGRKYGEYRAAISQASKQLQEAEERFNTEISAKEDVCKAVNLDKMNLEATVLQLKNQIEARSAELEANNKGSKLEKDALLTQIAAAEKRIAEISRSNQMAQEAFNAEKENLLSRLAELQTNLELTVSEKGSLSETNRELTTEAESLKAHLTGYSERLVRMEGEKKALEAVSVSRAESLEDLLRQNATMETEHGRKYGEYQAAISQAGKQLQEAEERFNTEISAKEDECKAVNLDKKNLEATVLHLKNQIEARSAELEANNKGWKLEKDVLLTQIGAAKKETAEISRSSQTAQEAFNAEKENLLSRLSELQKSLELMANEKQSLSKTNRELKTEGESLKAQLNKYSEKLVSMEDEKQALEAVSSSKAERFDALLKQNQTMEKEISNLQQQVDENVKQHSHVIQQYKVEENSLKQQKERLEKEVLTARCLLEIRDNSINERIVENNKLSNQVEELRKIIVELQEANVNVVQEKDEFESLHTESVKKYKVMEEKHSELFKEKEEQAETINSLRGEINSLMEYVKKYKAMEEKQTELFKEKEEQAETISSLRGEINSRMESVKKYKLMEEKHSELFKEKEERAKTINSLRGEINSLMESVKKYKLMEEKHSELFKEKELTKTINSLRGEINSLMESVNKYKMMEEKHSELFKEKEEQAKTINSLRGEINSLMDEKRSLSRDLKETAKKHEDFPKKCIQSQHPAIAQENRTKLLDTVNHMDLNKTPKPTNVNGKQNRNNGIEKPKPTDVNEKRGMQEKRTPNGGHQSKAQKKPHFRI